jgi:hypothetical protein
MMAAIPEPEIGEIAFIIKTSKNILKRKNVHLDILNWLTKKKWYHMEDPNLNSMTITIEKDNNIHYNFYYGNDSNTFSSRSTSLLFLNSSEIIWIEKFSKTTLYSIDFWELRTQIKNYTYTSIIQPFQKRCIVLYS